MAFSMGGRSSGRGIRRRPFGFRRTPQRLEWNGAGGLLLNVTSGTRLAAITIPNSVIRTMTRPTLERVHGEIIISASAISNGSPAAGGQISNAAVGMEVLPQTVTATEVEFPTNDITSNRWFYHHQSPLVYIDPVVQGPNYAIDGYATILSNVRLLVDVRSKRRLGETDQLWIALGSSPISTTSPPDVSLAYSLRFLFRETRG